MQKYKLYINDIIRAIILIERTTKNKTFNQFKRNINLIDATAMRLQIIGESTKNIPSKIKSKIKNIKWSNFDEIRNLISHAYFKVNSKILWDIIKIELPPLKRELNKLKKHLNNK